MLERFDNLHSVRSKMNSNLAPFALVLGDAVECVLGVSKDPQPVK